MESRRMRGAPIVLVVSLLWSSASAGNISIYWGQDGKEASLADTCASGNFKIVLLAFLITFGNGQMLVLNLAGHCDPPSGACKRLSADIESCQSRGIKVFLSLGGSVSSINIISVEDAQDVAAYLWNNYLGGSSSDRPLGDAVLDGIDFDIQATTGHLVDLARALSAYSTSSKKVYLSAAPQCPYSDAHLDAALQMGLFDYVWIQFYNNPPCQVVANGDPSNLVKSWTLWTTSIPQTSSIYLGLPAALGAAPRGGYIEPYKLINNVLPQIKTSPKYGGVMRCGLNITH